MQPTVKERHLSHGLSAQHETTYFAGTGAIQAAEQRCHDRPVHRHPWRRQRRHPLRLAVQLDQPVHVRLGHGPGDQRQHPDGDDAEGADSATNPVSQTVSRLHELVRLWRLRLSPHANRLFWAFSGRTSDQASPSGRGRCIACGGLGGWPSWTLVFICR
jgi:hypothetical protein